MSNKPFSAKAIATFSLILTSCDAGMALAQDAVLPAISVDASGDGAPVSAAAAARADLAPDSLANFARVAPSSRIHTETFTRQDIEDLHPTDVFDLLSHATSVVVIQQGRKLPFSLMIRGDTNFGFIVDGAYITPGTAGTVLQSLPVAAIESVEIIRDPTALTLGPMVNFGSASGALNSGFIVIRTRTPLKTEGEVRMFGGNFGSVGVNGYAGKVVPAGPNTPSAYVAGFSSYKQADGPTGYNAQRLESTGLLKGGVGIGPFQTDWSIYQDIAHYGFQRATEGQNTAALVAQKWSYSPIDTTLLTSNSTMTWDEHNTTLVNLAYNAVQSKVIQASYSNASSSVVPDRTYTMDANARHSFNYFDTLLQLGVQYVAWSTPTGQMFYAGYARQENTLSGYANLERKFLNDRLTFDASVRFDDHTIDKGVDLYNAGTGAGSGGGGKTYQYFYNRTLPLANNYAAGASYAIVPGIVASARYAHTEQGGVVDLVSATGAPLSGESQNKFEFGLNASVSKLFSPGITFFDTNIQNDKTVTSYKVINGYQTPLWSQSNTQRQGVEFLANGLIGSTPMGSTSYRASFTHLTLLDSTAIAAPYAQLIPHNTANLAVTQSWQKWSGTATLTYVSGYMNNFNSLDGQYHEVGNFVTVDLNVGYSFQLPWAEAKLTVYGRNITDQKYETVYGYPAWGAIWGSELKMTF